MQASTAMIHPWLTPLLVALSAKQQAYCRATRTSASISHRNQVGRPVTSGSTARDLSLQSNAQQQQHIEALIHLPGQHMQ